MIQNYYPIDFQAQYEDTSEKMIQISKKYKDAILNAQPQPINKIEDQLEDIQNAIEGSELNFRKESIYSQFAPGQLMAERRKQPPEMCPECGEELKKQVQCEFCAQIFCKKCCSRNRVIPFISKDSRLCCEPCHWKFVKLFDNAQFYEEKEKLINVANFVRNKINKINQKIDSKKEEVQEVRNYKRNQKIKEKNIQKKIQDEEKYLLKLQEEFKIVVSEKANKIKENERQKQEEKRKREQQQRMKMIEQQQRARQIQIKKKEENEQQKEARERLEDIERQRERKRIQLQDEIQNQKRILEQQKKEEQLKRKYEQQIRKKNEELQELKRQVLSQSNEKKERKQSSEDSKSTSKKQIEQIETPKIQQKEENQKLVDIEVTSLTNNAKSVKSIKQSEESSNTEKIRKKNSREEVTPIRKLQILKEEKKMVEQTKPEQSDDPLERSLAKMLKLNSKEEENVSVSNVSRTSKNVMDMSVKQLLGMRIPVPTSNPKFQKQEESPLAERTSRQDLNDMRDNEQPRSPLSSSEPPQRATVDRNSYKPVETSNAPPLSKEQVEINRKELIKNSSMLSSTLKDQTKPVSFGQVDGKKCQCEIM